MMRRSRLIRKLQDYVAGDLDLAAREEIERRIEGDAKLRALCEELAQAHAALVSLRDRPEPPVSAKQALPAIQAAIGARRFESRPRLYLDGQGRRHYQRLALAATLLLALTVGLWALSNGDESGAAPTKPRPPVERDLIPRDALVEGGIRGGLDAATVLEILERAGKDARDVVVTPNGVLPVAEGSTERR